MPKQELSSVLGTCIAPRVINSQIFEISFFKNKQHGEMCVECNKNNRDGSKLVEWHSTWVSLQIKPYREKSHATLNKAFYNNMNSHSKKSIRQRQNKFNAQSNLYFCRVLFITYNTISHKHQSFCDEPFVSKARYFGAAVNMQQH